MEGQIVSKRKLFNISFSNESSYTESSVSCHFITASNGQLLFMPALGEQFIGSIEEKPGDPRYLIVGFLARKSGDHVTFLSSEKLDLYGYQTGGTYHLVFLKIPPSRKTLPEVFNFPNVEAQNGQWAIYYPFAFPPLWPEDQVATLLKLELLDLATDDKFKRLSENIYQSYQRRSQGRIASLLRHLETLKQLV